MTQPFKICRAPFSLTITVCVFLTLVSVPASTPPAAVEDQARAVLNTFEAAGKAKDAKAVSTLLSKDCIIIMTGPASVSAHTRFYTKDSFLKLLAERYSQTTASASKRVIREISTSDSGDVFVTTDFEERARIGDRSEWIRGHEYIVMKQAGKDMLIRFVVGEMIFYAPDVPPDPAPEHKSDGNG